MSTASGKGKELVVYELEAEPISVVQTQIDLLMDEVNEYVDEEIQFFDD